MQGCPCRVSNNPNPFLSLRRGFNHSPTLANILTPKGISDFVDEARAKKESHGRPWLSLCFGKPGRRLGLFFIGWRAIIPLYSLNLRAPADR
jgi:hypothetical protein